MVYNQHFLMGSLFCGFLANDDSLQREIAHQTKLAKYQKMLVQRVLEGAQTERIASFIAQSQYLTFPCVAIYVVTPVRLEVIVRKLQLYLLAWKPLGPVTLDRNTV